MNVDAAVGVLDVDNTAIEAVKQTEKNEVVTQKTFSDLKNGV